MLWSIKVFLTWRLPKKRPHTNDQAWAQCSLWRELPSSGGSSSPIRSISTINISVPIFFLFNKVRSLLTKVTYHSTWEKRGKWKCFEMKNGITGACSTADCCALLTICPRCYPRHTPDISQMMLLLKSFKWMDSWLEGWMAYCFFKQQHFEPKKTICAQLYELSG